MAERKKTLFHVVRPFILVFNLLYGLNLGNRKPLGCAKRVRKTLQKHLVWHSLLFSFTMYCYDKLEQHESIFHSRWILLINLFCASFYLFAFNEPEMERLVRRTKKYKTGEVSAKVTSNTILVFMITLGLLSLPVLNTMPGLVQGICIKGSCDLNNYLDNAEVSGRAALWLLASSAFYFNVTCSLIFFSTIWLFPVLLSCLCCVLVIYCPSRLDDHVEDIRRAHSPLRRGKLITRLCHAYYQLQPLASMTNRNMAATMSLLKIFTLLMWAVCCGLLEKLQIGSISNIPVLQYSFPLLMYLRVAPSANDTQLKLFKAAAEVLMVDDEWQLHDPISRSLLLKMRLNLLQHLGHIRMDQGPFTLLGDAVDPETLFTIFVEANDMRTVLV